MKVAFTGGSGFIASHFKEKYSEFSFVDLKRNESSEQWMEKLMDVDVVINLAGAPIFQRWTSQNKQVIENSRIETTRKLVACLNRMEQKAPELFISGSAIGIYSNKGDQPLTEDSMVYGSNFLTKVVRNWEAEANELKNSSVRLVIARIGIVLGNNGGIIRQMKPIFKMGIGGILGSGEQKMSFVHIDDLVAVFKFFIADKRTSGVYNMVAPEVVDNRKFTKEFALQLKKRVFLPVPSFVLKIMFGQPAEIMLKGEWVISEKLQLSDFTFQFPNLKLALKQLMNA